MNAKKALMILVLLMLFTGFIRANEKYQVVKVWPEVSSGWHFYQPWGVAIDELGNVYIADSGNYSIKKFDSDGRFILQWGSPGKQDGQFRNIRNIKVNISGTIYVVDLDRDKHEYNRIQKFTSYGQFIGTFERKAPGVDQFELPVDIAMCPQGNVFVLAVDFAPGNKRRGPVRIEKYSTDGEFLIQWGSMGTDDGQFLHPAGIDVDTQGDIYIIDQENQRIQKFNSEGKFLMKWERTGKGDGLFDDPRGIAFDKKGDVYILDRYSIQKFTPFGQFLAKWNIIGKRANRIAADSHGNIYVTDVIASKVMKFKPNGYLVKEWGSAGSGDGQFNVPRGIAVDDQGNVIVSDDRNNRIQKFDSQGKFLSKWESNVTWKDRVCNLAIDTFGNLYALSAYNLLKLDTYGKVVSKWGTKGSEDSQFNNAKGIAIDRSGNIYVADTSNHRIQKLTSEGKFLVKWGGKGTGDGQFNMPEGIAVDSLGNVYVCDRQNCRVQKFDSDGMFLAKWGKEGSGDGEFKFPAAVAVDKKGDVYVADTDNHRIQKFTAEGKFLTEWGQFGEAPGRFNVPLGIAVDDVANVYVSDSHNHRIQKFAPAHP